LNIFNILLICLCNCNILTTLNYYLSNIGLNATQRSNINMFCKSNIIIGHRKPLALLLENVERK